MGAVLKTSSSQSKTSPNQNKLDNFNNFTKQKALDPIETVIVYVKEKDIRKMDKLSPNTIKNFNLILMKGQGIQVDSNIHTNDNSLQQRREIKT